MTATVEASGPTDAASPRPTDPDVALPWRLPAAVVVVVGAGLRFWPRPALWLDEAQSVAFARLPLTQIPGALRQDGAPPLYYLLLHVWMRLAGDGDTAVRWLSALCSLAAIGVVAVVARRMAGPTAALCAVVMMATNPFAIRYATETRMYALVTLEVALLALSLHSCLRRDGGLASHAGVALCTAALLYTHYWSLYLLGALVCATAVMSRWPRGASRSAARRRATRALLVLLAGFVLWVPWLPSFDFQRTHTGTPWATASLRSVLPRSVREGSPIPIFVYGTFVALTLLVIGRAVLRRRSDADVPALRVAFGALFVGAVFAWIGATLSNSALVIRYTSVFFPLVVVLVAAGLATLTQRRVLVAVLVVASVIGTTASVYGVGTDRTPAHRFAKALARETGPDDVIVYCPDQLGPAVSRLLERQHLPLADHQVVFPAGGGTAGRVNWINYEARYANAQAWSFAGALSSQAGAATVWLVWSGVYPPTQGACTGLYESLEWLRPEPTLVVPEDFSDGDHAALWRFDA